MTLLSEILSGEPLTTGEMEALRGAALGETAAQTAARLHYATETVKTHRKRACAKLDAPNLLRAVVVAIATGVLNLDALVDDDL